MSNLSQTAESFLNETFATEFCPDCGGDACHHTAYPFLGNWFAKCTFPEMGDDQTPHPVIAAYREAVEIADKWVKKIGIGFHPDHAGLDYLPPLSAAEIAEYDSDMNRLLSLAGDPYGVCVEAMERAGLTGEGKPK